MAECAGRVFVVTDLCDWDTPCVNRVGNLKSALLTHKAGSLSLKNRYRKQKDVGLFNRLRWNVVQNEQQVEFIKGPRQSLMIRKKPKGITLHEQQGLYVASLNGLDEGCGLPGG